MYESKTLKTSLVVQWLKKKKKTSCQYRGHVFNPWYRKTAHAKKQLSQCITSTEPVLWNPQGTTAEACMP